MMPQFYLPKRLSTREAQASDREDIRRFLTSMLAEFGLDLDHYGTDSDIAELPESYQGGYFGLIEEGDKLVGTFALYPLGGGRAEVRKMYLHPDLRGQGIGKQLLGFVEGVAEENQFNELELQTASAMTAARGMYEHAGYKEIDANSKTERCDRRYHKRLYG